MANFKDRLRGEINKKLEAAKLALRVGASAVAMDAKNLCPVRTGKLKSSITLGETKNGEVYIVSANAQNKKGLNYAFFVEFDPKINSPFLYPAFYKNADSIKANVKKAIEGAE